jgi:hypothetical protein
MARRRVPAVEPPARGLYMSGTSAAQHADAESKEERVRRASELLGQAQQLLDASAVPPEIGARLQHVIDSLAELREDGSQAED